MGPLAKIILYYNIMNENIEEVMGNISLEYYPLGTVTVCNNKGIVN